MIREGPVEEGAGVTLTGQFFDLGGLSSSAAGDKGNEINVGFPQSNSTTLTDFEIFELFGDLEHTATIPPRKRNLEANLQAAATGAG